MQNYFGDNNVCNSISLFLPIIILSFSISISLSHSLQLSLSIFLSLNYCSPLSLCHVTSYIHLKLNATEYRIAGNFRGIQFSRFSQLTGKPRKLNPRNKSLNAHSRYSDRPSSKIRSRNLCILILDLPSVTGRSTEAIRPAL